MAKVMISFPDELLERIDEHARRRGTTRSGLLQELAARELSSDAAARRRKVSALLATADHHGGANARLVRDQRLAR